MGWLVGNSPMHSERFFPVPMSQAFAALQQVVAEDFRLKSVDEFTMAVSFSSFASAFTWGENFSAQVVSADGGALVRVEGVGKVGGQIQQSSRLAKLVEKLYADLSTVLRSQQPGSA